MMISPEMFADEYKENSYEELIKVRDNLIQDIRRFEKGNITEEEMMTKPSQDTRYQCNLEYLAEICKLIQEKYNQKLWNDDND